MAAAKKSKKQRKSSMIYQPSTSKATFRPDYYDDHAEFECAYDYFMMWMLVALESKTK